MPHGEGSRDEAGLGPNVRGRFLADPPRAGFAPLVAKWHVARELQAARELLA